jgi:dihydroorotate dehydrogenase (NAD+) catalytic subunit
MDCVLYLGRGGKRDLVLTSPVLAAAGALGYGQGAGDQGVRAHLGAYVTPPLVWHPNPETGHPRGVHTVAGYLRGAEAPSGLHATLRHHRRTWERLGIPVIAALDAETGDAVAQMAARLAGVECIQALELHLPRDCRAAWVHDLVQAATSAAPIPCLVRVPLEEAVPLALAAEEAGADGIVVAAPPWGRVWSPESAWVTGPLHSPALAPVYTQTLYQVARQVQIPLIGRGGIAEPRDALALVMAGAVAVQADSILWVRPTALGELYLGLEHAMALRGANTWNEMLTLCHTPPSTP